MSMVSSLSVAMRRSINGSIGDVTNHPDDMLNHFAMVSVMRSAESSGKQ